MYISIKDEIMSIRTTTITEFRKSIKNYFDSVIDNHDTVIIPREKDGVVVISLEEYNSFKETGHLLSTSANAERLRASISQVKKGLLKKKKLVEK